MSATGPGESPPTAATGLTAVLKLDAFHNHWWSRAPYRHIQVGFTLHLDRFSGGPVIFELLLPVDALDNFSNAAGDWNPAYDSVVDGVDYYVWTEYGDYGSSRSGSPMAQEIASTLVVNLKPYVNPLPLLWHACVGEDTAPPWNTESIDLRPYAPSM